MCHQFFVIIGEGSGFLEMGFDSLQEAISKCESVNSKCVIYEMKEVIIPKLIHEHFTPAQYLNQERAKNVD